MQQVSKEKCRKLGRYHDYDPEVRAKIAKHACQHGNKSAALRFTQELGHSVSESSVRNMKKAYLRVLKSVPDSDEVVSLSHASLGRPLLLGEELDTKIVEYIQALHLAGNIVNRSIEQAGRE